MERQAGPQTINNSFYDELGDDWYTSDSHPIALLRAENALRVPWIINEIGKDKAVLDIGCGAGMLTNALAKEGHEVFGIDLSENSLKVAQKKDATGKVKYAKANAYALPYENESFDVVCAMDILEHVEEPSLLIQEAARVLKPDGLFFFHTFNRNFLSYLVVIKGIDWFVPNAPKNMHVYPLFIKPKELKQLCFEKHLCIVALHGFRPKLLSLPLLKMLIQKRVPENFGFRFSKSLATGYCGYAKKF